MAPLIVFVSGTDTEIGKTWVGARLIERLRDAGLEVAARKPVVSFDQADASTDTAVLASAAGVSPEEVTPAHRMYPLALAPPMAAEVLERPEIRLQDLIAETTLPDGGVVVVEGVGGPRSPLAHDGDSVGLAQALAPDLVVIVASAGLGTVNAAILSSEAFAPLGTLVYLNRFDPQDDLHERNRRWLGEHHGLQVVASIEELGVVVSRMQAERASAVG